MIKTRLIKLLQHAKKYVVYQVLVQWASLLCQVVIIASCAHLFSDAITMQWTSSHAVRYVLAAAIGILLRFLLDRLYVRASYLASVDVKRILRDRIYEKLLKLGASYKEKVSSSAVVQMAGEGVEQLETYFGKYLSQFFYALLAPLTLFIILSRIDLKASVVLLIAVPLIPIVIMVVMIVARKLLDKYFNIYYGLGDSFLEKLHGMTTLKIYQADEAAAMDMDRESEKFRKVTMKVLTMQLSSTTIMDIVAYGGAAIGIVTALSEYFSGNVTLYGTIMMILLSSEFFLPMRLLGSYFHIGMNGMKASDRIFTFLDLPEEEVGTKDLESDSLNIQMSHVSYSYDGKREVLKDISMSFVPGSFTSIVGISGSGKSTIAGILTGRNRHYEGSVMINGTELSDLSESSLLSHVTMVSHDSWLFKGTIRENLLMGNPDASEENMKDALKRTRLLDFIEEEGGLDLKLEEGAANLSGGQRQRLTLARALLHDSAVYIFDEATSSVDMESEKAILSVIHELARTKTVILISHRLSNVTASDEIYLLKNGELIEKGTHEELIHGNGEYAELYISQKTLEDYASVQEVEA